MKKTSEEILNRMLENYPKLESCRAEIVKATEAMILCYQNKGKLLVCGNGVSAADSEHIVG